MGGCLLRDVDDVVGGVVGRGAPGLAEGTRRVLRVRGAVLTSVGFLARQLARAAAGDGVRARVRHRRAMRAHDRRSQGRAGGSGVGREQDRDRRVARFYQYKSREVDPRREGRRRYAGPRPRRRATLRRE